MSIFDEDVPQYCQRPRIIYYGTLDDYNTAESHEHGKEGDASILLQMFNFLMGTWTLRMKCARIFNSDWKNLIEGTKASR